MQFIEKTTDLLMVILVISICKTFLNRPSNYVFLIENLSGFDSFYLSSSYY